jgi:hypothetical protein
MRSWTTRNQGNVSKVVRQYLHSVVDTRLTGILLCYGSQATAIYG